MKMNNPPESRRRVAPERLSVTSMASSQVSPWAAVTPEELAGITVFPALDDASREHLAKVAADMTLSAGEYAAHERSSCRRVLPRRRSRVIRLRPTSLATQQLLSAMTSSG